jgi:hypothetical protein
VKRLTLVLIEVTLSSFLAFGQPVIYTPTGSSVSYDYEEEMSPEQIEDADEYWQGRIDQNNWDAVIIGSSSNQYNCHAYAWHVSDGGNLVWINSPANYYSGGSPTYVSTSNTDDSLRKIVYNYSYGGGHSAISTNTEEYVVSKWGAGPLVRHAMYDWPWIGESQPEGADYYEIDIDCGTTVKFRGTINETTININGASYNWTGDNYYICASDNSYITTVVGLQLTPPGTYTSIKVEITSPYSNTTVKGDKKNYISVYNSEQLPTISASGGSRLVCSSGLSFTVNNLPQGWTIEWLCGSNLTRYSQDGSNPCTFVSTGNGASWVNAIVHPPCGGFQLTQYDVWSGIPQLNVTGPSEGTIYNTYTFYANPATYSSPTDYDWILNPLLNNEVNDYGYYSDIDFYDEYEGYQVICRAKNVCSSGAWGEWSLINIIIYDGERFIISPNPASDFLTVSKSLASNQLSIDSKLDPIYEVKIYDLNGILRLSSKNTGNKFLIPLNNLKDGKYYLQISKNNKHFIYPFIIKH